MIDFSHRAVLEFAQCLSQYILLISPWTTFQAQCSFWFNPCHHRVVVWQDELCCGQVMFLCAVITDLHIVPD